MITSSLNARDGRRWFSFEHLFGCEDIPDLDSSKARNETVPDPKTILVVDDERLVADTVAEILKRNGYEALSVYSGSAAIEIAQRRCPDVLMCDVLMPQLDGIATAVAVRELCQKTRVLLFSGHVTNAEVISKARSSGHDFEFLAKPLHPATLLRLLAA